VITPDNFCTNQTQKKKNASGSMHQAGGGGRSHAKEKASGSTHQAGGGGRSHAAASAKLAAASSSAGLRHDLLIRDNYVTIY
jgi:hypothetical protein